MRRAFSRAAPFSGPGRTPSPARLVASLFKVGQAGDGRRTDFNTPPKPRRWLTRQERVGTGAQEPAEVLATFTENRVAPDFDFLDDPASTATQDFTFLDEAPAEPAKQPAIEVPKSAMPYDRVRFACLKGTDRVWACDGEFVACRPNAFHEGSRTRHQRFLSMGHYQHVGTFDDVQVFKLLDGSPFRYDTPRDVRDMSSFELERQTAIAACKRDWALYVDILVEISTRLKSSYELAFAKQCYEESLARIENFIVMRGGPSAAETAAGLQIVRRRRGEASGRQILLPVQSRRVQ